MRSDQFSLPRRDVIRGAGTIMALASLAGAGEVAASEPAPTPTPAPVAKQPYTPARGTDAFPRPRFRHMDQEQWREMRVQDHGGKRVSVHEKWLEFNPRLLAFVGKWDPGMIIAQHGHMGINVIYVMEGSMMCGDVLCTKGMSITLEIGTPYGPNIAGPDGVTLYEVIVGDPTSWYADNEGFEALKKARGVVQLPPPPQKMPATATLRADAPDGIAPGALGTRPYFNKPYPKPRFKHADEEEWREMRVQDHSGKRVAVHEKWLDFHPRIFTFLGRWDPGMIIAQHGHLCINTIFILEGSMVSGGVECTKGMHITLDIGTPYGPNIAGPQGCTVIELMTGDVTPWFADNEGFEALKREHGAVQIPPPPQTFPKGAFC